MSNRQFQNFREYALKSSENQRFSTSLNNNIQRLHPNLKNGSLKLKNET